MEIDVDLQKVFSMIEKLGERSWYGKVTLSFQKGIVCNMKVEESINLRKVERDNAETAWS